MRKCATKSWAIAGMLMLGLLIPSVEGSQRLADCCGNFGLISFLGAGLPSWKSPRIPGLDEAAAAAKRLRDAAAAELQRNADVAAAAAKRQRDAAAAVLQRNADAAAAELKRQRDATAAELQRKADVAAAAAKRQRDAAAAELKKTGDAINDVAKPAGELFADGAKKTGAAIIGAGEDALEYLTIRWRTLRADRIVLNDETPEVSILWFEKDQFVRIQLRNEGDASVEFELQSGVDANIVESRQLSGINAAVNQNNQYDGENFSWPVITLRLKDGGNTIVHVEGKNDTSVWGRFLNTNNETREEAKANENEARNSSRRKDPNHVIPEDIDVLVADALENHSAGWYFSVDMGLYRGTSWFGPFNDEDEAWASQSSIGIMLQDADVDPETVVRTEPKYFERDPND